LQRHGIMASERSGITMLQRSGIMTSPC